MAACTGCARSAAGAHLLQLLHAALLALDLLRHRLERLALELDHLRLELGEQLRDVRRARRRRPPLVELRHHAAQPRLRLQQLRLLLLEAVLQLHLLVLLQPELVRGLEHLVEALVVGELRLQVLHLLLQHPLVLLHLHDRLLDLVRRDELRLVLLRRLVRLLELLLQVLVVLVDLDDLLVGEEVLRHLHVHQEARQVRALLQLRHALQHPREHRVDELRLAVQQRRLGLLLVERDLVVEHLHEAQHPRRRRLGRLVPQVDAVLLRQVGEHRVDDLEQLERALLVEGDHREVHLERRLVEPVHDELQLIADISHDRAVGPRECERSAPLRAERTSCGRRSTEAHAHAHATIIDMHCCRVCRCSHAISSDVRAGPAPLPSSHRSSHATLTSHTGRARRTCFTIIPATCGRQRAISNMMREPPRSWFCLDGHIRNRIAAPRVVVPRPARPLRALRRVRASLLTSPSKRSTLHCPHATSPVPLCTAAASSL